MTDQDFLEQFQIMYEKMDQMSRQMATKDDIKDMATKSDLKDLETRLREEIRRFETELTAKIDGVEARLRQEIIRVENRLNSSIISKTATDDDIERIANRAAVMAGALIENKLGKRIDSLSDGYKLTHEKQYELEHRMDVLERAIDDLRTRIAWRKEKEA